LGKKLFIESLEIRTDAAAATYRFKPGVNAITGPISSGKSSLLELIKYGLGGTALVMPAVRDNVRTVVLRFRAGDEHWEFTRALGSHVVQVYDLKSQEALGEWAATNRQNMRRIGSELMDALGLPRDWRIAKSRKRPTDETVPVSFWDVYKYLYVDQNRIDTSVIGHTDPNLDNKRIAVFELIYGLANPRTVELQTERGKRRAEAKSLREKASFVARFLEDMGEPEHAEVVPRRVALASELEAARSALVEARSAAESGLVSRESLTAVAAGRARLDDLTSRRNALETSIEEAESVVAQLDLDETQVRRSASASQSLSGLEFVQCPRCLQSLPNDRFNEQHCQLCGQPQAPGEDSKPVEAMLRVVREQRSETQDLLLADRAALAALVAEGEAVQASLFAELRQVSDEGVRPGSPLLALIEEATSRVTACEAALARLGETEARWATQEQMHADADELDKAARRFAEEEARLKLELSENSTGLLELSDLFSEILRGLRDPWFTEAHVDPNTYLPMVDGELFEMLAVGGGRKTIVNLAYHLANLYVSLSEGMSMLLPTLLIVDSPRKNVGQDELDQSVVSAIYARLRTLQDASPDRFQIIFVDNDMPSEAQEWVAAHIALDYERPLVPGVEHTGEREATIGSTETVEMD
jgi:hypothetical protein